VSDGIAAALLDGETRTANLPTHAGAGALFETRALTLSYGERTALRNVSLLLRAGVITSFVGPSGCGKTSLLMCLARLLDPRDSVRLSGQVWLDGQDLYDPLLDLVALRRRIGVVFQRPNPFPLSIRKNVEIALREHGMRDRRAIAERVEQSLRRVGLWHEVKDRLHHSALSLSGGQQQRLCIARALALGPRVLLMDEPCSALDPLASAVVEELIVELGCHHTVIMVTHNLAQARRISQEAAFFWVEKGAGCLVEQGSSEQIFRYPQHGLTAAYVGGAKG
jgi:phosphate transport system ATP-binding protein